MDIWICIYINPRNRKRVSTAPEGAEFTPRMASRVAAWCLAVVAPRSLHPAPYTLHPAPCTLHPAPYTLHPAPCTLHPAPYTLHPAPYTLVWGGGSAVCAPLGVLFCYVRSSLQVRIRACR